jgi:hypothetical protein
MKKGSVLRKGCVFVFFDLVHRGRLPVYSLISSFRKITESAARQAQVTIIAIRLPVF